jgi:division protein CdvB (Snf7/Vps24/ESCRT-III family)
LSSDYVKKWKERDGSRIKSVFKPTPSLESKIRDAIRRIEVQNRYLKNTLNSLSERDKRLFSKVVDAYSSHNSQRAKVFANELAEVRKMANYLMNSELALERVVLRLQTATQMGNLMVLLAPANKVLRNIRSGIKDILPATERELGNIEILLDNIMVDTGQTMGITPDFQVANEDARKILEEAAIVTEEKMKEKFPELPALKQPEKEIREEYGYTQN